MRDSRSRSRVSRSEPAAPFIEAALSVDLSRYKRYIKADVIHTERDWLTNESGQHGLYITRCSAVPLLAVPVFPWLAARAAR